MSDWSIEEFCQSQPSPDWQSTVSVASNRQFLEALSSLEHVSVVHPFCGPNAPRPYNIPGIPPQGPLQTHDHFETWQDVLITIAAQGLPSLLAMLELWLRLFASIIAPLGVAHMIRLELNVSMQQSTNSSEPKSSAFSWIIPLLTMASSIVMMTDELYVMQYGPRYGVGLWVAATVLVLRIAIRRRQTLLRMGLLGLILVTMGLTVHIETGSIALGGINQVKIDQGLYYDPSQSMAQSIVQHWPASFRDYDSVKTPWMPTGDSRTGLPFLLNRVASPELQRLWLSVDDGQEAVALDVALPPGGHNSDHPVYMILHGLNGGSKEDFVRQMMWQRTAEGSTVICMVARGLMDLPVRGWDVFHGARWTDAHQAALALRTIVAPGQMLVGVGYSMGGIIMSNYLARAGTECALDAAVAISGGLDMREEARFNRAHRLWQPLITPKLRDEFVLGKFGERVRSRLTKEQMKLLMRASNVAGVDKSAVVNYNGFDDLMHYYSEMSALGDIPFEELKSDQLSPGRRINNITVPHLVLHALDDPLISWRTIVSNEGWKHPSKLSTTGSGNLFLLLTKGGGHVGWPHGWLPFLSKWTFMNDAAASFVNAVQAAKEHI